MATNSTFLHRRDALRKLGAVVAATSTASLVGCATTRAQPAPPPPAATTQPPIARIKLAPIRATPDRITGVYVCTRPFRSAGPRIEMERIGHKNVVHNYGHGGSGWSLSWGSSAMAVEMARATNVRELGVIGCGALGLTSALTAQRAGLSVRIYAKALPPDVLSMRASGVWSPASRICDGDHVEQFGNRWETMARTSFARYQTMLGLPGNPIQWIDSYYVSDGQDTPGPDDEPEYNEGDLLQRLHDIKVHSADLSADENPVAQPNARRITSMMFNITTYARMLMDDFLRMGGTIEVREFAAPHDLMALKEHTLINATGYGARALFKDESIIPVRGQTARLIPQPEVTYGISSHNLSIVPRSDGILVQRWGDSGNFNNPDATPRREDSDAAVDDLAAIMSGLKS
jgi:glycine/D-amino acid oxidase-like deaminating enzyme